MCGGNPKGNRLHRYRYFYVSVHTSNERERENQAMCYVGSAVVIGNVRTVKVKRHSSVSFSKKFCETTEKSKKKRERQRVNAEKTSCPFRVSVT